MLNTLLLWIQSHGSALVKSCLLLFLGWPILRVMAGLSKRTVTRYTSLQTGQLVYKLLLYSGTFLIVLMVLRELGFKLTALLGAAGIVGVAVGFASQTSLSNLISGLFLLGEKPFQAGDVLQVGATLGKVVSIDLLSCKLQTFDNKFIRIPNENLIKTEFTNMTRYPIRRYDMDIGVAYKEDIERIIAVLKDVADNNPLCLDEPEPIVVFRGFGDSSINFTFGVWVVSGHYVDLRNTIAHDVKTRFDKEGIEIPFPHRTLYTGSVTSPMPIQMVHEKAPESD